jgi:hypothetical protein
MENNYFIIIIIVLAAVFLLSRMITLRAMKYLANEQKAELVDISRRMSRYQLIVLFALVAGLVGAMKFAKQYSGTVILIYFFALVAFIIIRSIYMYFMLRKKGFPKEYLSAMLLSMAMQAAAIIVFGFVFIKTMYTAAG